MDIVNPVDSLGMSIFKSYIYPSRMKNDGSRAALTIAKTLAVIVEQPGNTNG